MEKAKDDKKMTVLATHCNRAFVVSPEHSKKFLEHKSNDENNKNFSEMSSEELFNQALQNASDIAEIKKEILTRTELFEELEKIINK